MKRHGKKQNRSGKRKVSSRSHIDENGDVHAQKHDRKHLLRSFMRDDSVAPTDSSSVEIAHDRVFRSNASINRKSRRSLIPGVTPRDNSLLDCKASSHIVCAISENLAKETCIASIDASSPISLTVVKQGNGQTYVETLAYLGILQPDEILLNEGRRNSLLVEKILSQFGDSKRRSEMKSLSETGSTTSSAVHRIPVFGGRVVSTNEKKSCKVEREGYESVIKFLPRSCFDQTKGADLLRRIARPESYDASIVEEYILLSSAYSVLQYAQSQLGANFSEKCLQLSMIVGGKSRMSIDRSTLLNLELLANSKTGKIQNSLIGTIDSTKTSVGCRLLRANLMAPPLDVNTINTRLDLVDAFIGNEQFFFQVMDHLEALPDINRMLAGIALIPWNRQGKREDTSASQRVASKGISSLICIKSLIEMMDSFAQVLDDRLRDMDARDLEMHRGESDVCHTSCQSDEIKTDCSSLQVGLGNSIGIGTESRHLNSHHLLRAIRFVMRQPALREILNAINDVFTESTSYASRSDAMRHQVCFALKPKTDGMLDVLRSTFLANVDDIYRLADEYAEKYNLRITVKHSAQRGYFLAITSELDSCLPDVMIQVVKSGRLINCTTEEVHSLNARAQDNIHDLLILTHEYIQEVMNFAREKYDALASLSDAIALLDLCHSFADNVTASSLPWTRPIVTKGGDLTIRNGRYGIDAPSGLAPPRASKTVSYQFVPNHTYAPAHKNFVIITGANGSGKIGIICILAHCGSFVPAEKAIIPIRDRLCTRIGIADDQEHNISTFLREMKEIAFICRHSGPLSLVLIDELGRATCNEDGVAIAWAVSEYLRSKRVATFFVTHYPQISKLADVYPGICNQHMDARLTEDGSGITYSHTIQNGACKLSSDYGVEIASTCGWPKEIVKTARDIRTELDSVLPNSEAQIVVTAKESQRMLIVHKTLLGLVSQLKNLSDIKDQLLLKEGLEKVRLAVVNLKMDILFSLRSTSSKVDFLEN